MARIKPRVTVSDSGMIQDEQTGLILPSRMTGTHRSGWRNANEMPAVMRNLLEQRGAFDDNLIRGFYHGGYAFRRDESTLVPFTEQKGSDSSEIMLDAIASGSVSNVGISPVVFPQISAVIRNQQVQTQSANIDLTGRQTPVRKARDALARFNDSPLGATDALSEITYNLRVYNRGSPIAMVPVTLDASVWREQGLKRIPILKNGQREEDANMFYLEVDWSRVGTPIPYLVEPLDVVPSGHHYWPYWVRCREGKSQFWVLMHHTQIIPLVPGKSRMPLIGTSSVWICLGFLMEEFLIIEERVEKKLASVASGLLGISGTSQNAQQLTQDLNNQKELMKEEGRFFGSDYAIITSALRPIRFEFLSLRQWDGVEFEKRRQYYEDVLALAMSEPLIGVVTRGGVGYGASAESASDRSSDQGASSILTLIEVAIGSIYPRLQVAISRPNDQAQRLNIQTMVNLASAVKDLNSALPEGSDPVLNREEIRTIIDREILSIPITGENVITSGATQDDTSESEGDPGGDVTSEDQANEGQSQNNNQPETQAQRNNRGVWNHFIQTLDFEKELLEYVYQV